MRRRRFLASAVWRFTMDSLSGLALALASVASPVLAVPPGGDGPAVVDSRVTLMAEIGMNVPRSLESQGRGPALRRGGSSNETRASSNMGALVKAARSDLAGRLGIPESQIAVVS